MNQPLPEDHSQVQWTWPPSQIHEFFGKLPAARDFSPGPEPDQPTLAYRSFLTEQTGDEPVREILARQAGAELKPSHLLDQGLFIIGNSPENLPAGDFQQHCLALSTGNCCKGIPATCLYAFGGNRPNSLIILLFHSGNWDRTGIVPVGSMPTGADGD